MQARSAEGDAASGHCKELLKNARAVVSDARVRVLVGHPLADAPNVLRRFLQRQSQDCKFFLSGFPKLQRGGTASPQPHS